MNTDLLWPLFGQCLLLSLLAIGGAVSTAPEMHRYLVTTQHWLTDAQFTAAVAIAQAAPGPNLLFIPVLGFQIAGLSGAVVAMAGTLIPSTTLALIATRWMRSRADWPFVQAIKAGLAPITLALVLATAWLLAGPRPGLPAVALSVVTALLVWRTRVHILALIMAGAVLGVLGVV